MSLHLVPLADVDASTGVDARGSDVDGGLGAMRTFEGNLPLTAVAVRAKVVGLVARVDLTQDFHNPHDVAVEATYIFPLPDRAAVVAMAMHADGRTVTAELAERGAARAAYDQAVAAGQRASIAEEERSDVFTMRVGNIAPGERVQLSLSLVGPLAYEDGEATLRLPLVVAPRYIPGAPLPGPAVGSGYADDTDAVPDASRITPPVLLPGFPNPVQLSIEVDIDPAGLPLGPVRASLPAEVDGNRLRVRPGQRLDRDFILRLGYGQAGERAHSLTLVADRPGEGERRAAPDGADGTFALTLLPPPGEVPARPRDVVLLLDRSGSMAGWKMVAARRAAARIVDTLTTADRFAVAAFDDRVEYPQPLGRALVVASDRNRFRAVEHLAGVDARGGTELLAPLVDALELLSGAGGTDHDSGPRDRVLVLVTDGQVGNEDQILARTTSALAGVRVHTVGIDQAVNAGFLGRLAAVGGGRCELVESDDRLDEAMARIHRRIGAPQVTGLSLSAEGVTLVPQSLSPARLPDLFPGAPVVLTGRYRRDPAGTAAVLRVDGRTRDGAPWTARVAGREGDDEPVRVIWARAHLRDLADTYAGAGPYAPGSPGTAELEARIVALSLWAGVLCRFTAWVAVDSRVVTSGGEPHRITQPVEPVAGWDMLAAPAMTLAGASSGFIPAGMHPMMPPPMAATSAPAGALMARRLAPRMGAREDKRAAAARAAEEAEYLAQQAAALAEQRRRQLEQARELGVTEARRLRALEQEAWYERREALADLGSRLSAMLAELREAGIEPGLLTALRQLADQLDGDQSMSMGEDVFERLWREALRLLDELARG